MSQFCGSSAVLSRRCGVTSAARAGIASGATGIDASAADRPLADTIFLPCVFPTAGMQAEGRSHAAIVGGSLAENAPPADAKSGPLSEGGRAAPCRAPAAATCRPARGNTLALAGDDLYKPRHLTRGPWLLPSGGSFPQGREL